MSYLSASKKAELKGKKKQSALLQLIQPDESKKGHINEGLVGQYPYFAPDVSNLVKAPKMTKADELYLRRLQEVVKNRELAGVEDTTLGLKEKLQRRGTLNKDGDFADPIDKTQINITINPRLYNERKTLDLAGGQGPKKGSLTDKIFGDQQYFATKEDTSKDKKMQKIVQEDWSSATVVPVGLQKAAGNGKAEYKDNRGPAGNVVPFFPTDWSKNANDMFNNDLFSGKPKVKYEVPYNELAHAAYHKRATENQVSTTLAKAMGKNSTPNEQHVTGARPTSGKHYARVTSGTVRRKPGEDPLTSTVAKNFEKTKKVEVLLGQLADYMAGDIPDLSKVDGLSTSLDPDAETMAFTSMNDALSQKDPKWKAGIFATYLEPKATTSSFKTAFPSHMQNDDDLQEIEEEHDTQPNFFPDINRKQPQKKSIGYGKVHDDPMFIYKDFDTSLTSVKKPRDRKAAIDETTRMRDEDLIRDRLLSFKYRNGSVQTDIGGDKMLQRKSKHQRSAVSVPKKGLWQPRKSQNMVHKAFWVHNQAEKGAQEFDPQLSYQTAANQQKSASTIRHTMQHSNSKAAFAPNDPLMQSPEDMLAFKSPIKSPDPLPIQQNEQIVSASDKKGEVKLVQQYVMIAGRLQPALKYIAPNPMFNRYKVKNGQQKDKFQEIVTYPTVTGDLKMKNKHVGVNYDDRHIPEKDLPEVEVEAKDDEEEQNKEEYGQEVAPKNEQMLEHVVNDINRKAVTYNRHYYQEKAIFEAAQDSDSDEISEIEDPRTLADIQQENITLKEQMIHQMMTLEQYANVAQMWMQDVEGILNPFEEFNDNQSMNYDMLNDQSIDHLIDNHSQSMLVNQTVSLPNINVRFTDGRPQPQWQDYKGGQQKNERSIDVAEQEYYQGEEEARGTSSMRDDLNRSPSPSRYDSPKNMLKIPKKVTQLGIKIKQLFFKKQTASEVLTKRTVRAPMASLHSQSGRNAATNISAVGNSQSGTNQHRHYQDFNEQKRLTVDNAKLRQQLESNQRNLRIIDLENKIRDNKRIIVNLLTDNIFVLRFGYQDNQKAIQRVDRDELLMRMLQARNKRIRIVESLLKVAKEHQVQLSTWGLHSDLVTCRLKIRSMNDIVVLLQEKNLLAEMRGAKRYTVVGEIEAELDWPLRIRNDFESKDFFSSELRLQIDQYNEVLRMLSSDRRQNELLKEKMKGFVSRMFGNDGWWKMVEARWLKLQQKKGLNEFDPKEKDEIPVYVKSNFREGPDQIIPVANLDELPNVGNDFFGKDLDGPQTSQALANRLERINRAKMHYSGKKKQTSATKKPIQSYLIKDPFDGRGIPEENSQGVAPADGPSAPFSPMHGGTLHSEEGSQQIDPASGQKEHPTAKTGGPGSPKSSLGRASDLQNQGKIPEGFTAGIEGANKTYQDQTKSSPKTSQTDFDKKDHLLPQETENTEQTDAVLDGEGRLAAVQREQAEKAEEERRLKEEQLALEAARQEKARKEAQSAAPAGESKWLLRIRQEQLDREKKIEDEKKARADRLKKLLAEESDDDDMPDYHQMLGGNVQDFLSNIENHLKAEQKVLDAWHEADYDKKLDKIEKSKDRATNQKFFGATTNS